MKRVAIRGAAPRWKDEVIEPVEIGISGHHPDPTYDDLAQWREKYAADARALFDALHGVLPGATFDRLLILMLQQTASQFIVSHKSLEPKEREAESSAIALLELALPMIEAEADRRSAAMGGDGVVEPDPYWTEMRVLADQIEITLAKVRGET